MLEMWRKVGLKGKAKGFAGGWFSRTMAGHLKSVSSVGINQDGRYAVSGSSDETIRLWTLQNGACVRIFKGTGFGVTSVCMSPDGQQVLAGSVDHKVRVWEIESGKCLTAWKGHKRSVTAISISPNGERGHGI